MTGRAVVKRATSEALRGWAGEHGVNPESLALKPDDPGVRITYLVSVPATERSVPDWGHASATGCPAPAWLHVGLDPRASSVASSWASSHRYATK